MLYFGETSTQSRKKGVPANASLFGCVRRLCISKIVKACTNLFSSDILVSGTADKANCKLCVNDGAGGADGASPKLVLPLRAVPDTDMIELMTIQTLAARCCMLFTRSFT